MRIKIQKFYKYILIFILSLTINLSIIDNKNIPTIFPDSESYLNIAKQINKLELPNFSIRTPTYPLYLSLFTSTNNLTLSVYVNAIIGAIGSIILLWISLKFTSSTVIALAISLFSISDIGIINFQSTILTESIAPTLILFCLFANIQILLTKKIKIFEILYISLADFLLMFLKPTFVILPILLKITYYLATYLFPNIITISKRKYIKFFCLINIFFILSFYFYEYARIGRFKPSILKQINTFGKLINYGYLNSSKPYPDAPADLLKAIEIYNKYPQPDKSPYTLLNILEKNKIITNRSNFLNKSNNYLLSKNWFDFFHQTILLIPKKFNLQPSYYSLPSNRATNNPLIKIIDFFHSYLYSSKLYVSLLCFLLFLKTFYKNQIITIHLWSMLFFCFFTIIAITFFSYAEFTRLRQPIDTILNFFLFLPPIYLFSKHKNKKLF